MRAGALLLAGAAATLGCSARPAPVKAERGSLGGAAARVGGETVPASLVAEVAAAQRVTPRAALDLLLEDALATAGARAAHLDGAPEVTLAVRAVLGRRVVHELRDAARAAGPPTDAEVAALTESHWLEVDAPERMRAIHAVVLAPKDHALEASATKLAAALAEAEAGATTAEDFEARARALPHEGLELRVERLDPFVADGRLALRAGGALDPDFVKGAVPLAPGATSGVVRSPFGWHVIHMIERLPERRVGLEARRTLFQDEALAARARRSLDALLDAASKREEVTLANGVDELMTEATMSSLGGAAPPAPPP